MPVHTAETSVIHHAHDPHLVAPAFIHYAAHIWQGSEATHATQLGVFEAFERGAQALGLRPNHRAIGMSYWLAFLADHALPCWTTAATPSSYAAALLIAVETHHTSSPAAADVVSRAFALSDAAHAHMLTVAPLLTPLIMAITMDEAVAHLRHVKAWEEAHAAIVAQRKIQLLWDAPPELDVITSIEAADFGMILEIIEVDDTMAAMFPYEELPRFLMLATSDRRDTPLAAMPWFGAMTSLQRTAALHTLLTVAVTSPDKIAAARPLILFLPEQDDVDAFIDEPCLEGMAISTHASLARHMEQVTPTSKPPSRTHTARQKQKKKSQRAARKVQRRRKK